MARLGRLDPQLDSPVAAPDASALTAPVVGKWQGTLRSGKVRDKGTASTPNPPTRDSPAVPLAHPRSEEPPY